jgi:SagB-type dehydrogenase family enzyme
VNASDQDALRVETVLSLRPDITLFESDGSISLGSASCRYVLTLPLRGLAGTLRRLASGGATEDQLADAVSAQYGERALPEFYYHLDRLYRQGLLCTSVAVNGESLITMVPLSPSFNRHMPVAIDPDAPVRLSRFAFVRREADLLVLESSRVPVRALLTPATVAMLAWLVNPDSARQLARRTCLAEEAVVAIISLLATTRMAVETAAGVSDEESDPALAQWEFHDLLIHNRSRLQRFNEPSGGTFRFLGRIPPGPAVNPERSQEVISLFRPDLGRLGEEDAAFTRILEQRASIRDYSDTPIDAQQLGEFLYRTARIRRLVPADPARGLLYETSTRPYPSAGATYDLELYVVANRCAGLRPGLYHYDPLDHALGAIAAPSAHLHALLSDARGAARLSGEPQILIILASRFQRVAWKYSGIAYALTLKNVGVLYQTMYLVATAMDLAACALGSGNPVFAAAVGSDPLVEPSVGEFLLGTPRRSTAAESVE